MNKIRKLITLILLSGSVYFIYNLTNNKTIIINSYGDNFQLGIDSYNKESKNYLDYYKEYLKEQRKKVVLEKEIDPYLSIKTLINKIDKELRIKKQLMNSNYLILSIGYNDLVSALSLEENLNVKDYNKIITNISINYKELITKLKKYHKQEIIVIGYYKTTKDDYYLNKGIRDLNNILKSNKDIIYIDTYTLLNDREKYFPNPTNNHPNQKAYELIATKIIRKTLEK